MCPDSVSTGVHGTKEASRGVHGGESERRDLTRVRRCSSSRRTQGELIHRASLINSNSCSKRLDQSNIIFSN